MKKLLLTFLLSGCTIFDQTEYLDTVGTAEAMVGLHEVSDRKQLRQLMGVDPLHYEWCAAFVNMILNLHYIDGSESVSEYPLTARSFLQWGVGVAEPQRGDIIVFPRGEYQWQGHVGFYVDTVYEDHLKYYLILGGNQNNSVSVEMYLAKSALSIRRQVQ